MIRMTFEFATATRIVFGSGAISQSAPAACEMGSRILVVSGRSPARANLLISRLQSAGMQTATFPIDGEPTVNIVREGVARAREHKADVIAAIGGGSAIDAGKAIAAVLANGGDPMDYLEVVGAGKPLRVPSTPFIAIPTTAGTGSEVTRNAVLGSPEHKVKASLRSPLMLPKLAIVDPELTLDLPPAITASTGLDALTQLIEPYVCSRANPMTDLFCVEGMRRVARSLRRAFEDGRSREAREDMALASLLGGLSLANAGLGVVHGFAAPVGGMYPAPHGAVCAALLPHGIAVNIRALRERAPQAEALRRYETVARILTGKDDAKPETAVDWVTETCERLQIPRLRTYGMEVSHIETIVDKASRASSMKANPIPLTPAELTDVLRRAL